MNAPRHEVDDETWMVRFQRGDRTAFAKIVGRHQKPLYNFVLRYVRTQSVAEELVQEAFVRIVQNALDYKEGARVSTWLYSIARNLCIDQLRRDAHRRHPSLDASKSTMEGRDERTLHERTADTRANVEREATGTDLKMRITVAVDALPDDQREVFLLREMGGIAFKDIAEMMGVSENTVKSRMRYALERLQEALSEYEEYAHALR